MTMLFSQHSPLRRIAFLTGMLMLLLSIGTSGALAASPSPAAAAPAASPAPAAAKPAPAAKPAAPAASPSASATAAPKFTPKVVTAPAPKKAGPRVLGPQAVPSAALPAPNCLLTCTLYAKEGSIMLPGPTLTSPRTVPIWGFTSGPTGLTDPATLPGPTLITLAGQPLSITLCNMLPAADGHVSLELPGAPVTPDITGVPGANSPSSCVPIVSPNNKTYILNGLAPGTYLYQAGATGMGARQVAMGLSGILIVRPSDYLPLVAQTAYGASSSRPGPFTAEGTMLVSEIDTEFNASPLTKDLVEYKPNYFLVNGRSFDPNNPASMALGQINVVAGDQLLLHEADLGLRDHEMGILGARQSIQATDSHLLTNPVNVSTNFLTSGQVADSFVQVDPGLGIGTQLPVYDSALHLHNDANPGLGGMLTYLDVIVGLGGLPGGPVTTDIAVSPKTNDGTATETVSGTITAQLGIVTAAEWFMDDIGAPGTGHPIPVPLNIGSTTFSFGISPADVLAAIAAAGHTPDGDHIIWVHGKDLLNWGDASGDTFTLNVSGALVYAITLHPTRTNGLPLSPTAPSGPANDQDGTADAVILATAQASLDGWIVDGAEYRIDGGAPAPLCTTPPPTTPVAGSGCPAAAPTVPPSLGGAAIVAVSGSIPQATLNGLADGPHTISIRAHELPPTGTCSANRCYSSWTLPGAQATLTKDTQGPVTSNMSVAPNPNNGTLSESGNLGFLDAVRVTATLSDASTGGSDVILGEAFLGDNAPPTTDYGSGAEMVPSTAKWTGVTQVAYAYIPLQEIRAHAEGIVKIWVHGKDSAGNWGTPQMVPLTLDITPPNIQSASATGTTGNATITVTADDPLSGGVHSNIVAAEWFVGTDPGYGAGNAVTGFAPATHVTFSFPVTGQPALAKVHVRVMDAAGNWSADSVVTIP